MTFPNRALLSIALAALTAHLAAQAPIASKPTNSAETERAAAGDSPDDPGPLATNLSHAMTPQAIAAAMRKVADWQLRTGEARFNQQWTFAPLYDGLLAASRTTGDPRYQDAVERAAVRFNWKLVQTRFPHADDEALGLPYLELYRIHPSPDKIADVRATMDRLIARPDDPQKNLWWWCDALFMAPPVLARLAQMTGNKQYLQYLDHEWSLTRTALYDEQQQLYSRDDRYLTRTEANGQKLFWSRGNGWVLAGLAEILQSMPNDDIKRPAYVAQFQRMASRIRALQQPDGLWRSGLLDQQAYESPEVSGSGFFLYAMAWGVNAGLLDRASYTPVIAKGWSGMLDHIYADGRLGNIQPIDAAPGAVKPSSSYVYGVGAFLLAGSEIDRMVRPAAGASAKRH